MILKINKSYPSLCTSNFDVLKLAMIFAKYNDLPLLIESTSNQVNQFGGYTHLKPKQFYKKLNILAKKIKFEKSFYIGADHLGPLPWKNLNERVAMKNSIKLFKDVVKSGYNKIHIDTGIKLKSDKTLSKKTIINRCKKIFNSINTKKLNNIFFVFGTEVPIAGGGQLYTTKTTSLSSIKADLKYYSKLQKSFSLVIEPGLGFDNNKVFNLKMNYFENKKSLSYLNNFSYEAHSSDFQNSFALKKLVKNNFKFLKVGPELTFFYMKAILQMQKIENMNNFKKKSNIKKIISTEMHKDNRYWVNYYQGSKKKIEYLKFNSLLDRSRYYWSKKKIIKSLSLLKKNINSLDIKSIFTTSKILKKKLHLQDKLKLNNFEFFIFCYLNKTLCKYYKACNYSLKKEI
tara:strand:- start:940 stop:2142 length:1203 start_codon:yes stop_codon:yes gene_type:complete